MSDSIRLTIPGRLDGLNQYTRACRSNPHAGAQMKEKNQESVMVAIWQQLKGERMDDPVYVYFTWYERDSRRDIDNVSGFGHKVILDALVRCGVLPDDSQKYVRGLSDTVVVDKRNPRIEVLIEKATVTRAGGR